MSHDSAEELKSLVCVDGLLLAFLIMNCTPLTSALASQQSELRLV